MKGRPTYSDFAFAVMGFLDTPRILRGFKKMKFRSSFTISQSSQKWRQFRKLAATCLDCCGERQLKQAEDCLSVYRGNRLRLSAKILRKLRIARRGSLELWRKATGRQESLISRGSSKYRQRKRMASCGRSTKMVLLFTRKFFIHLF